MAKIKIPTVNEKLLMKYIRHSVYLEQLKKGEASLISRFLKQKVFPNIYGKLMGELGKVKNLETLGSIRKIPIRRLKKMLAATQKISVAGAVKAEKMLINRLVNISRFEAKWNADLISKTVPTDIDMTMPSNEVLKKLVTVRPMDGHKLGTWMKGYSSAIRVAMTKQVKIGIATGESLPAIGARINKALGWKGKQAQYIARTAVSNVVHQAREEVFKKNTDIVRKVQWISTLDDRTSMQCIHLDGRMFNVGDGPRPPIHFNCRSSVIPITPSWQEFGIEDPPPMTRASMNGAVPAKMNYRTWIKTQPKAVQVKVLGKKRAELYRDGRVKIDRFVGRDLKPLTLKQLARREGIPTDDFLPAPPPKVKAMSVKNNGIDLTPADFKRLENYSWENYSGNIVKAQLNKPLRKWWNYPTKKEALLEATKMERTLDKLDGYTGTSYRGLKFRTIKQRQAFLTKFKEGSVWKGESFQSSTKSLTVAKDFMKEEAKFYASKNSVLMHMDGVSGRDLTNRMQEVLFKAGTPFKITKIKGNEVWLQEITKQAQLKVLPAPPLPTVNVYRGLKTGKLYPIEADLKMLQTPTGTKLISKVTGEEVLLDQAASKAALAKLKVLPAPPTATKVGTTFTKTTSKEFQDIVTKQIDSYPEKVKAGLNKRGITYKTGLKMTETDPALAVTHPRGWPAGASWDSVGGLYNQQKKSITVVETIRPIRQKVFVKNSKNQIQSALNHETGHGFDWVADGIIYSGRLEFSSAWVKDIKAMGGKIGAKKKGLRYYIQTGGIGQEETFAEVFAELMGQNLQTNIGQYFPNCKKYIEDLLK